MWMGHTISPKVRDAHRAQKRMQTYSPYSELGKRPKGQHNRYHQYTYNLFHRVRCTKLAGTAEEDQAEEVQACLCPENWTPNT